MLLILVVNVVLAILGVLAYHLWQRRKTQDLTSLLYSVTDPEGIEDLCEVNINGLNQWLHIRGKNCTNPILLFLHGGPGVPHIGWFDAIQRPWEEFFTVVQWDQRQTGKSYYPLSEVGESMTNQQLVDDAESVVGYLRQRFNHQKIVIMGWSNGTCLGMHLVKRQPEWFYAYVGVGQVVNRVEMVNEEYELLKRYAQRQNDRQLLSALEDIAPRLDLDNKSASRLQHSGLISTLLDTVGKGLLRYHTGSDVMRLIQSRQQRSPLITLKDLFNSRYGDKSADLYPELPFGDELMDVDLPSDIGSSFEAPIIFFTGRHDWHVPCQLTDNWFQIIEAPYKQQVWFEESAHMPYIDEPGRFLLALIEVVLPLTQTADTALNEQESVL